MGDAAIWKAYSLNDAARKNARMTASEGYMIKKFRRKKMTLHIRSEFQLKGQKILLYQNNRGKEERRVFILIPR
jgi:hypothetical protein